MDDNNSVFIGLRYRLDLIEAKVESPFLCDKVKSYQRISVSVQ